MVNQHKKHDPCATNSLRDGPILCSNFWTAATAYFYAPNREILFPGVDREPVRFNDKMLAAYSLSAAERVHMKDGEMRRLLIDNGLVVDPEKDWASVQQVALISASKDLHEKRLLASLGFTEVDTPPQQAMIAGRHHLSRPGHES
jgi:hypothetical protein